MNHEQIEGFAAILHEIPTLTEIEVRTGEATLRLRRKVRPAFSHPSRIPSPPTSPPPLTVVLAQHVGTFQGLGNNAPHVGDLLKVGQLLGQLDTMRLLSDCKATVGGRLHAIHVEDGQPVEYGQPLFEILPEGL